MRKRKCGYAWFGIWITLLALNAQGAGNTQCRRLSVNLSDCKGKIFLLEHREWIL